VEGPGRAEETGRVGRKSRSERRRGGALDKNWTRFEGLGCDTVGLDRLLSYAPGLELS